MDHKYWCTERGCEKSAANGFKGYKTKGPWTKHYNKFHNGAPPPTESHREAGFVLPAPASVAIPSESTIPIPSEPAPEAPEQIPAEPSIGVNTPLQEEGASSAPQPATVTPIPAIALDSVAASSEATAPIGSQPASGASEQPAESLSVVDNPLQEEKTPKSLPQAAIISPKPPKKQPYTHTRLDSVEKLDPKEQPKSQIRANSGAATLPAPAQELVVTSSADVVTTAAYIIETSVEHTIKKVTTVIEDDLTEPASTDDAESKIPGEPLSSAVTESISSFEASIEVQIEKPGQQPRGENSPLIQASDTQPEEVEADHPTQILENQIGEKEAESRPQGKTNELEESPKQSGSPSIKRSKEDNQYQTGEKRPHSSNGDDHARNTKPKLDHIQDHEPQCSENEHRPDEAYQCWLNHWKGIEASSVATSRKIVAAPAIWDTHNAICAVTEAVNFATDTKVFGLADTAAISAFANQVSPDGTFKSSKPQKVAYPKCLLIIPWDLQSKDHSHQLIVVLEPDNSGKLLPRHSIRIMDSGQIFDGETLDSNNNVKQGNPPNIPARLTVMDSRKIYLIGAEGSPKGKVSNQIRNAARALQWYRSSPNERPNFIFSYHNELPWIQHPVAEQTPRYHRCATHSILNAWAYAMNIHKSINVSWKGTEEHYAEVIDVVNLAVSGNCNFKLIYWCMRTIGFLNTPTTTSGQRDFDRTVRTIQGRCLEDRVRAALKDEESTATTSSEPLTTAPGPISDTSEPTIETGIEDIDPELQKVLLESLKAGAAASHD